MLGRPASPSSSVPPDPVKIPSLSGDLVQGEGGRGCKGKGKWGKSGEQWLRRWWSVLSGNESILATSHALPCLHVQTDNLPHPQESSIHLVVELKLVLMMMVMTRRRRIMIVITSTDHLKQLLTPSLARRFLLFSIPRGELDIIRDRNHVMMLQR